MIYLLDANILINAGRDYYPPNRVPEYWDWLIYQGKSDSVKIPSEISSEIEIGASSANSSNDLIGWIKTPPVQDALLYHEAVSGPNTRTVIAQGYDLDPDDEAKVAGIGQDYCLISYALADKENIRIVTAEKSRPSAQGVKRKIPDVCDDLGVTCINAFELNEELDFSTDWKQRYG